LPNFCASPENNPVGYYSAIAISALISLMPLGFAIYISCTYKKRDIETNQRIDDYIKKTVDEHAKDNS
jgi:hypothetical protein